MADEVETPIQKLIRESFAMIGETPTAAKDYPSQGRTKRPRVSRVQSEAFDAAVGPRMSTAERLEREFFGTHYKVKFKPRLVIERPSAMSAVIHIFTDGTSLTTSCIYVPALDLPNYEVIHHHHRYDDGCFANYGCHLIEEDDEGESPIE